MSFQYSSYGTILMISAFIVLSLAIYSYKKRSSNFHIYFTLLMLSVFFWCFGSALEFFSIEIWAKIFWIKISYIGVATAAPLWFIVALTYSKQEKYSKTNYILLLMLLPLIIITMAFTNDWHGLLWPSIIPSSNLPGIFLVYEHGPIFWISIFYSFLMILIGIIFLIQILADSPKIYRPQIYILLLSGFIPLIFSLLYITKAISIPGLDITPFGLTISGILIAIDTFKFSFLDIRPIAHKTLLKSMGNGFMVFDTDNKLIEINPSMNIIGIDNSYVGKHVEEVLDNFPELKEFYKESKSESEIFIGDSINRWIHMQITPIYDDEKVFYGRLITIQDINKRKKIEKELIDSEERYKVLTELSPDAIAVIIDRKIIFANKASSILLGAESPEDIIGKDIMNFIHPDYKEISKKRLHEVYTFRKSLNFLEEKIVTLTGEVKDIEVGDVPIIYDNQPAVQLVVRDITERKKLEAQLKKSLEEKNIMMKEIHHRVKNNLIVIESLLNLQSRYIKDKEALNIFKESQNRAKSMALIHQRLYQSSDLKSVDFGDYTRTLTWDIFRSYVTDASRIKLNIDVENIMLDVNTAIPLGLILNELVSNSIKHAFPEDYTHRPDLQSSNLSTETEPGNVTVKFSLKNDDEYNLTVTDDGIGFPKELYYENNDSLGLRLVNSLSEQIHAKVNLDTKNGTKFEIIFKENIKV